MVPGFYWRRIVDPEHRMYTEGERAFMVDARDDAYATSVVWDNVYSDSAHEARRWCKENLSGRWHVDQGPYIAVVRIWNDTEATAFAVAFC